MSRIGKKVIAVPPGVEIEVSGQVVTVKGPKGELVLPLHAKVRATADGGALRVTVENPADRRQNALWGTFWSLLNNAIVGVTRGFEKKLEVIGVGYKASTAAGKLILNLGYSHPIELAVPQGLEVKVEKNTIVVAGISNRAVGQFAALVRSQRKPEPYKGKGIRYQDEVVRRKAGKVVKAVGA